MKLRRRVINEAWWDSKTRSKLSFMAREVFMGLWCLADREGRFEWDMKLVFAKLYPRDFDLFEDFKTCVNDLIDCECIEKYEIDGENYGCVLNLNKYQKIPIREARSTLPSHSNTTTNKESVCDCTTTACNCTATALQLHTNYKTSSPSTSTSTSALTSTSTTAKAAEICREVETILGNNGLKIINSMKSLPEAENLIDAGVTLPDIRLIYKAVLEKKLRDYLIDRLTGGYWAKCIADHYEELLKVANAPAPGEMSDSVKRSQELIELANESPEGVISR